MKFGITTDVKERPPMPGWRYHAFVVHPRGPGPVILAIAHAEGCKRVLDVIRESIEIADCSALVKRYGIDRVVGAPQGGEGDSLAHAAAGALTLAGAAA